MARRSTRAVSGVCLAVSLAWVDPGERHPAICLTKKEAVSLGTLLSWGMGVVKTSMGCLSLPPALPPVWSEETPPNNLAPMFTSPHRPVPSSQLFSGHTSPPLEQEECWEARCLVPHTRGLAHSRCSARSRCSADTCTHLGSIFWRDCWFYKGQVMDFCNWDQCRQPGGHGGYWKRLNFVTTYVFLFFFF